MNNEPVAWIDKSKLDDWLHGDCYPDQCFIHYQANDAIPLYTHPVKELTDEEILECWNETHPAVVCLNAELPLFARAILRKASEK